LFLNPIDDAEFSALAESLAGDPQITPEELQGGLRLTFPAAVVRARDLSGEKDRIWYVYRDGHWVPPTKEGPHDI
jgi:hypothetical protein